MWGSGLQRSFSRFRTTETERGWLQIYVYECVCVCVYVYRMILRVWCMNVCVYACVLCMYMYVCMYVCIHTHAHTHTHTHTHIHIHIFNEKRVSRYHTSLPHKFTTE
jgi:hypothetical protein